MTTAKLRNVGASVRARLLDLARKSGDEFNYVLTRYRAAGHPALRADHGICKRPAETEPVACLRHQGTPPSQDADPGRCEHPASHLPDDGSGQPGTDRPPPWNMEPRPGMERVKQPTRSDNHPAARRIRPTLVRRTGGGWPTLPLACVTQVRRPGFILQDDS